MLIRAYRVSDKLSIVLLKTISGTSLWLLDGVQIITTVGRRSGGGALGIILAVLLLLFGIVRSILQTIWRVLHRLVTLVWGIAGGAGNVAGRGVGRVTGNVRTSAGSAATGAMARRAARAELENNLAEDPLKIQNRFLSAVVVAVLAVLVVVVIIATGGGADDNAPVALAPDAINLSVGSDEANALTPTVDSGLLATPVPTATSLPEVLAARGSLAFVVRELGQSDIWVSNVDNRNPIRVTNSPEDDRDPSWSPDGQRIAYASRRDGNWDLYLLDLNNVSAQPERLTLGLGFQGAPVWSPDAAFLAYESYQNGNLDIFLLSIDGTSLPTALPMMTESAEFSPAWSPLGRQIAYVSWQNGNQDIYVFDLDNGETVNVTNTPNRHEDYPAWSPDGSLIAYSALDQGIEKIFVKSIDSLSEPAQVIARGRNPSWSPEGNSIVFAVDSFEGTQFIVEPYVAGGITTPVFSVAFPADNPSWTDVPLPATLVNAGGLDVGVEEELYIEQVTLRNDDPPFGLQSLPGVEGAELPILSDRVDDSYNALREQVNNDTGDDFLGTLEHALWDLDYRPNPNEPNRNWHRTGRAFAFNRNLLLGFPAQIEIVREDTDLQTFWRVYVRVDGDIQSGELGEPLRRMPWEFVSLDDNNVEAYDAGGRLQSTLPEGYYVDLTQIAADYGWSRVAAGSDWRANAFTRNYWMFIKSEGLTWYEAMLEIYTVSQLGGFNPTATPAPPETNDSEDG